MKYDYHYSNNEYQLERKEESITTLDSYCKSEDVTYSGIIESIEFIQTKLTQDLRVTIDLFHKELQKSEYNTWEWNEDIISEEDEEEYHEYDRHYKYIVKKYGNIIEIGIREYEIDSTKVLNYIEYNLARTNPSNLISTLFCIDDNGNKVFSFKVYLYGGSTGSDDSNILTNDGIKYIMHIIDNFDKFKSHNK